MAAASPNRNDQEMEVYVCYRSLREMSGRLYRRLPNKLKDCLRDVGLCHYMAIIKSPEGELIQFDFGPVGGDIALPGRLRAAPSHQHQFASMSQSSDPFGDSMQLGNGAFSFPRGEIRQETLTDGLPQTAVLVGKSRLSLSDIQRFNESQNTDYELNRNDCRHYVDALVNYATGANRASAYLMRHTVRQKITRPPRLRDRAIQVAQLAFEKESTALLARVVAIVKTAGLVVVTLNLGKRFKIGERITRSHVPMMRFNLPNL